LAQVALTVRELSRSVAFYRDVVGLKMLFEAPNVAFFDVGPVRLMLGANEEASRTPYGTIVYFAVPELQPAFAALVAKGASVVREPHLVAKLPDHDLWMAFFRDPDENVFALMSEVRPA
jgi:methylmalonyl-CoA/ethylmalonyl-CoA epimerase